MRGHPSAEAVLRLTTPWQLTRLRWTAPFDSRLGATPIHQNRPSHRLGPLPSLLSVKLPGGLSRCYSDRTLRRNARQRFLFESAMYGMP
jgi:hypothetical protein